MKKWKPLQRANPGLLTDAHVRAGAQQTGLTETEIRTALEAEAAEAEYYVNDLYQVAVTPLVDANGKVQAKHLNIRRRDGRPIFRDWRHFQQIKNELVGEECEGFEIYPAESRLSDTSNKYHLFAYTDPAYRIPFGMKTRDVLDDVGVKKGGFRQRKL